MTTDDTIAEGAFTFAHLGPVLAPLEYTGWRREILSAKETAHIGTALHGVSPVYDVSGPDALKLLRSVAINSFNNFEVGQIRHAVLCNDKGQILADGVIAHIDEDTYRTYWLAPVLEYYVVNSDLDVHGTDQSTNEFFFQVAGLRSLEILEAASGEDLHDIRFGRHRMTSIAGVPVRILRLGMAGTLGYELHGAMADTEKVYNAIWEAGQEFGLVKQGRVSYLMQHTEAGFPNINLHYPLPWYEDPDLGAFYDTRPQFNFYNKYRALVGSVGDELEPRFVTPFQVGWGKMVDFNHDFIGKAALEREAAADARATVTLVWNEEDVAAIYASQFSGRDVEPIDPIDARPVDIYFNPNDNAGWAYHADWVLADGERIGTSVLRTHSVYYRRMISIGLIDKAHSAQGTELTVLWGRPGGPQKEVRVTVDRYPFYDLPNNSKIDVETIPRRHADVAAALS
ncbi:aminomethyltransferase family protein [Herbiconiux ginsengi]|uniref:Glycine cleavage system T protein (Aminomethyltransferase) n=1 Tax=Herbiconiux ginsengi TaxID=381665 RepID=A0A1H3LNP6_9MICO|nr:aminomethyltransferase family protein [Herbiconiux ginsengi]SDY65940.1 Glycine cleavage system T protein (aminomethyltransferase) [Herbiconiux ginsengi]